MRVQGYIDGIIGGALVGWVVDREQPLRRLTVHASLDGRSLGVQAASLERADLRAAGVGDGESGFRFPLDGELAPGEHVVVVEVEDGGEVEDGSEVVDLVEGWFVLDDSGAPRRDVMLVAGGAATRDGAGGALPTEEEEAIPLDADFVPEAPPGLAPTEPAPTEPAAPAPRAEPAPPPVAPAAPPVPSAPAVEQPLEPLALAGTGGWLFSLPRGTREGRAARRAEVDRARAAAEKLHAAAAAAGVVAVVARMPAKLEVYADRLPPAAVERFTDPLPGLVAAELKDSDTVSLLDLGDVLRAARRHGRVYTRTGVRPTWVGAFHAYRAVVKRLALTLADVLPLPVGELELGPLAPVDDDLSAVRRVAWLDDGPIELSGAAAGAADREPALDAAALEALRPPGRRLRRLLAVHEGDGQRIGWLLGRHTASMRIVEAPTVDLSLLEEDRPQAVVWLTQSLGERASGA